MSTQINGWQKLIFIVTGILLSLVIGSVVVTALLFSEIRASLIPDEKEEEKIIKQAKQYLQTEYPNMQYEISYVLYDSGEQYGNFDYAAVILDTETKKSFKVYENRYTEKIEDDRSIQEATEFIEQVKPKVFSYISKNFEDTQGMAFTPTYDVGGTPTLTIGLNNNREEINEEKFLLLIDYIQHELNIEHAYVTIKFENVTETWG